MTRAADIQAHIGNIVELRDIVGAMRSLASMRAQRTQQLLPGIRGYADAMARGIETALLLGSTPSSPAATASGPRAIVLFTAEHGFVGGFNERLFDAATAALGRRDRLLILGTRGIVSGEERGLEPVWTSPMATRPEAATEPTRRLTTQLYRHIARGEVNRVEIIFAKHRQGRDITVERKPVFPVDVTRFAAVPDRQPPLHNIAAAPLLEKLIADYVFAQLAEAAVESLASENAARFAAMQAAHDNITVKLETLRGTARQARQDEITTELLDLTTGAAAQSGARQLQA